MSESFEQSVTHWIHEMKQGDDLAAQQLWDRFFPKLVNAAKRKMGNAARRIADEEDVAVDVFNSLCVGAREGKFDKLEDRNDLWRLLVAMAGKKAVDQIRRQTSQKRGGVDLRGESVFMQKVDRELGVGFDQFDSSEPTGDFLAEIEEQQIRLFSLLRNDDLRKIAKMRLEGANNNEIAEELGISVRSVERKLALIRDSWVDELGDF